MTTFPIEVIEGDYGFALPIDIARLRNDRVALVPLKSNYEGFCDVIAKETGDGSTFEFVKYGPFKTGSKFVSLLKNEIEVHDNVMLFAILVRACTIQRRAMGGTETEEMIVEEGTFAGVTGLLEANVAFSSVEIGHVCIMPRFQRTFVATQAHGLLLRHLLDPIPHDLGLRRVQWLTHSANKASIKAAERLGFRLEGIVRWARVLPMGKRGAETDHDRTNGLPIEDRLGNKLGPARHTAQLSLCWDDWRDGGREKVDALMKR